MMGDYHVRFCERLGVKFPRPTRLYFGLFAALKIAHRAEVSQIIRSKQGFRYMATHHTQKSAAAFAATLLLFCDARSGQRP